MRVVGLAVLVVAIAVSGCSRNPMVKRSRLTPRPMNVAFAGFAVNRFYEKEDGKMSVVPVLNVDAQYAAFRGRLGENTVGRFVFAADSLVKNNASYRGRVNPRGPSALIEAAKTDAPTGMMRPRATDVDLARELCQVLGVDGVLWVSTTLKQVGKRSIGGVGEYQLQARTELALIGRSGKVWRDVLTMTSDASFPAVKGVALPASLDGAAAELANRVPVRMAERLHRKAP